MEVLNIEKEFTWVLKVLKSCYNYEQVIVSTKLFHSFIKKWDNDISDIKKITFSSYFNIQKTNQILEINKKSLN
jgi:hypothetical protein